MAQDIVASDAQTTGRKYKVLKLVCNYCGEEHFVIVACPHCGEPLDYKETLVLEYHEIRDMLDKGIDIEGLNKFPEFKEDDFSTGESGLDASNPLTPEDIDALFDSEDWGL